MRATATIGVGMHDGRLRYETLRSDPPLLVRVCGDVVQLVGGAAGPIGGDELVHEVIVGAGAPLVVRSVAASMVLPGDGPSSSQVLAEVGVGAHLDWAPEPLISVQGSAHVQRSVVRLVGGASLVWREIVVLGRTGEPPGTLSTTLRVERDGRVLTHQELRFGDGADGWAGPAGVGDAGAVVTEVRVGPGAHETAVHHEGDCRAAVFRLSADASVRTAVGSDALAAVSCLRSLTDPSLTAP